jgi:hypothetical protein
MFTLSPPSFFFVLFVCLVLTWAGFHRSTEPKGKVEPGVTLIERFSHPMFLLNREELIPHIHRKTAAATKRIKTEDSDVALGLTASPAFAQALAHSEEQGPRSLSELREAVSRLEGQVCLVEHLLFFFFSL